jgi:hypothetical protein
MAFWAYLGTRENLFEALFWLALSFPCFTYWWLRRPNPRKEWQSTPALREEYRGQVTDSALEARLAGADARIPWKLFASQLASNTVLVLLLGPHMHVPLAKRFFSSDEDWAAASSLIVQKVPPLKARPAVRFGTILIWLTLALIIFLFWSVSKSLK